MYNKFIYYCLMPTMIWTSMKSIELDNFFSLWMFMEMNSFNFTVLLTLMKKNKSASLIYFLIQIFSSSILLFLLILIKFINNLFNFFNFFFQLTLFIKIGIMPFHFWILMISLNLNWMNIFFLLTFQKLIPIIMFIQFSMMNYMTFMILFLSLIFSTISTLKIINLKLIMTYSSINHSSWILLLSLFNMKMFLLYFFIYMMLTFNLLWMFNLFNLSSSINFIKLNFNKNFNLLIMLLIISYSGFLPFISFINKWLMMEILSMNKFMYSMLFIYLFSSLLFMYIYMKIILPMFLYPTSKMKMKYFNFFNNKITYFKSFMYSLMCSFYIYINFFF